MYAKDGALLSFYRDGNAKEIDVFVEENGRIHSLEVKKSANPNKGEVKKFDGVCGNLAASFEAAWGLPAKNGSIFGREAAIRSLGEYFATPAAGFACRSFAFRLPSCS